MRTLASSATILLLLSVLACFHREPPDLASLRQTSLSTTYDWSYWQQVASTNPEHFAQARAICAEPPTAETPNCRALLLPAIGQDLENTVRRLEALAREIGLPAPPPLPTASNPTPQPPKGVSR